MRNLIVMALFRSYARPSGATPSSRSRSPSSISIPTRSAAWPHCSIPLQDQAEKIVVMVTARAGWPLWESCAILPELRDQAQLHHRQEATDHPMGARAHSRGGAAPARRAFGEDASAARDGRAPLRHDQGSDGRNPLPDEDAATGCRRDGAACAGLQPDPRHEHHGYQTAPGGDEGIVVADMRPSAVAEPYKTAGIRIRNTSRRKEPTNPEK
jgi:hypothetical protein